MRNPLSYRAVAAASLCLGTTLGQVGNEVLFVGSSTSGSADQHVFAESASGSVLVAGGESYTDNVTGAVWSDQGRRLYVGQSLMDRVSVAAWDGAIASWSTFYSAGGPCYGVEMDAGRNILWTLTPTATGTRQLVGLDALLGSPTYGQVIAQTASLTATLRERWGISPSGNLAAVPAALLGSLDLVDLDPASSTYLQVVASAPVTGASGLAFSMSAEVDAAEAYAYLLYAGTATSAIAVWCTPAFSMVHSVPGERSTTRSAAFVTSRPPLRCSSWVGKRPKSRRGANSMRAVPVPSITRIRSVRPAMRFGRPSEQSR